MRRAEANALAKRMVRVSRGRWHSCGEAGVYCDDHHKTYDVYVGKVHVAWVPQRYGEAQRFARMLRTEVARLLSRGPR